MTVCHTKKWMPVSTKASDPTVLQWLFLFRRNYVGKTYLADRDVCKSNLSLCVCVTYDFDPVLPISDMQGTTHWALWYSQWLHRQTTSFQILPKFPPPTPFQISFCWTSYHAAIIIPVYLLVVLHVPQLALSQKKPHRSPTQWTHKYQYLFST